MSKLKDDFNKYGLEYAQHTVEEIKRLRYWFAGFEAAGGKLPASETGLGALYKAQICIEDYANLIKKHGKFDKE